MSDWRCNLKNWALEISRDNVPGMDHVNKYGRNIEIDSTVRADIWDGGYTVASGGVSLIWVAPTAARVHAIESSDDNDGKTGAPSSTGARTVRVTGLQTWASAESSEDITLDGTTAVNTANSYVIIHRIKVLTWGTGGPNLGIVKATAASDNTITAQIEIAKGQTQMAIYGVPSTKTAYVMSFYAEMNKAGGASAVCDIDLCVNPDASTDETKFLTKHTTGLLSTGTSHFNHAFLIPNSFAGPAIIKMQALSGTNNVDISSGFDIVLVDN